MTASSASNEAPAVAPTSRLNHLEMQQPMLRDADHRAGGSATPADAIPTPSTGERHTIESVTERLEQAGATLLCLPASGARTDLRTTRWPVIHAAIDAYGWSGARLRPALPVAAAISRMDEALGWIRLIPQQSYVLRRIVGARALVSPLTGRHLFTWRRLGTLLGADARAVKRWHAKGITVIVCSLNGTTTC